MTHVELFDGSSCCGPVKASSEDLGARFLADAAWLQESGVEVSRWVLSSDPAEFTRQAAVNSLLAAQGTAALPALVVDGEVKVSGRYPTRDELAQWCAVEAARGEQVQA